MGSFYGKLLLHYPGVASIQSPGLFRSGALSPSYQEKKGIN